MNGWTKGFMIRCLTACAASAELEVRSKEKDRSVFQVEEIFSSRFLTAFLIFV
jgi:hypothetical protein